MPATTRSGRHEAPLTRFELFGGKGGTGKTTCAAARAVDAALHGERVLAVSTDPAHSLADAFDVSPPGDERRRIDLGDGPGSLHIAHLEAAAAWKRWLDEVRDSLHRIAEGGTYLERGDVARLLALPLPGADELVGLLELLRLRSSGDLDLVVVDSAPTGQMFRLLDSPRALDGLARLLAAMQEKRRAVAEALTGRPLPPEDDAAIERIEADSRAVAGLLRDPEVTTVRWVCLAEPLALAETVRALRRLRQSGIAVAEVIFNRLLAASRGPGERTAVDRARAAQRQVLRRARVEITDVRFRTVPEMGIEPRGVDRLRRLAARLDAPADLPAGVPPVGADAGTGAERPPVGPPPDWFQGLLGPGRAILFFGGKGGTGKSTCAAAVAVRQALSGERRVVLVSTDPAQALRPLLQDGSLASRVDDLELRELDAEAQLQQWRQQHGDEVAGLLRGLTRKGGVEAGLDRAVLERFLETPPPGMDEILALASLVDIVEGARGVVVCDTAPTGHALRLLAMPDVGLAWDHALMEILLEYKEMLPLGDLAQELVALARRLRRFRELLLDRERCGFVVVTRLGRLPSLETGRLLRQLDKLGIHVPALIVNAVPGDDGDTVDRLREALPDDAPPPCDILLAPERQPPPRGASDLARWVQHWSLHRS